MNILYLTSEAVPFIKSGGLGDVAGSLPISLKNKSADIRVVLPLYSDIANSYKDSMTYIGQVDVPLGWRHQYAGLYSLIHNGVTFYFIDNEFYFKRKGLYGYFDDGERFAFFSKACLEVIPLMDFKVDILHANDWQTALASVYLDIFYRDIKLYKHIRTVLSIHNIKFQGEMDKFCITDVFGIPDEYKQVAEYNGNANMLKAGIEASSRVVTVSPTYSEEIFHPYFSEGLDPILRPRSYKVSGILNGIDTVLFEPLKDKALFKNFSSKSIARKKENKNGIQKLLGLPEKNYPMIGMVTRLTSQKGVDLILQVLNEILSMDVQMVLLGTGDWIYENQFKEFSSRYPSKLSAVISFSEDLASKIYAASDLFLMPSQFEPCGLSQLIAMRYGSVPIVRETGGLKDTVIPFNPLTKEGTGFTFKSYNAYDMLDAIKRAVSAYNNKEDWKACQTNAMKKDFSWDKSAISYLEMYNKI